MKKLIAVTIAALALAGTATADAIHYLRPGEFTEFKGIACRASTPKQAYQGMSCFRDDGGKGYSVVMNKDTIFVFDSHNQPVFSESQP